eukprot:COSAG05_NODE_386_length_10463_cov_4.066673_2_plen_131_part_00
MPQPRRGRTCLGLHPCVCPCVSCVACGAAFFRPKQSADTLATAQLGHAGALRSTFTLERLSKDVAARFEEFEARQFEAHAENVARQQLCEKDMAEQLEMVEAELKANHSAISETQAQLMRKMEELLSRVK